MLTLHCICCYCKTTRVDELVDSANAQVKGDVYSIIINNSTDDVMDRMVAEQQLQDAPGRMVDTRCSDDDTDHAFVNWMVYASPSFASAAPLSRVMAVRFFAQGAGAVNPLGGLLPDTTVCMRVGGKRGRGKRG